MRDDIDGLIEVAYNLQNDSIAEIYLDLKECGFDVSLEYVREKCAKMDNLNRERQGADL